MGSNMVMHEKIVKGLIITAAMCVGRVNRPRDLT